MELLEGWALHLEVYSQNRVMATKSGGADMVRLSERTWWVVEGPAGAPAEESPASGTRALQSWPPHLGRCPLVVVHGVLRSCQASQERRRRLCLLWG